MGLHLNSYGDTISYTPNLTSFFAKGLQYNNAYVTSASCSPSRSSIITGLYPSQNGHIALSQKNNPRIKSKFHTIFDILEDKDVFTGILGKFHVKRDSIPIKADYEAMNHREAKYSSSLIKYLDEFYDTIPKQENYFLHITLTDPHSDYPMDIEGVPKVKVNSSEVTAFPFQTIADEQQLTEISRYYTAINRVDSLFQNIVQRIDTTNTMVIFVSDHGAPFIRSKTFSYEAGIKVPMMIRTPDGPTGFTDELVSTVDILPTVLNYLGIDWNFNYSLPGIDLLNSQQNIMPRESIYSEFGCHGLSTCFRRRSLRKGKYKLIYNMDVDSVGAKTVQIIDRDRIYYRITKNRIKVTEAERALFENSISPKRWELFDLEKDPYEFNNLAYNPDYKAIIQDLSKELFRKMYLKDSFLPLNKSAFNRQLKRDTITLTDQWQPISDENIVLSRSNIYGASKTAGISQKLDLGYTILTVHDTIILESHTKIIIPSGVDSIQIYVPRANQLRVLDDQFEIPLRIETMSRENQIMIKAKF
jgi:N-sulfoglucosamine sulfohydrolase